MTAKRFPCIPNPNISENLKKVLSVAQYVIMSQTSLAVLIDMSILLIIMS